MSRYTDSSGVTSLVAIARNGGASEEACAILEQTLVPYVAAVRRETVEECIAQVPNAESADTDDIQNALRALLFTFRRRQALNCTRCKRWTDRPDAHGMCVGCHDYANARYVVTDGVIAAGPASASVMERNQLRVDLEIARKIATEKANALASAMERIDAARRNIRAYRDGLVDPHDVIRRIENVLTVPHVHPSHMPSFDPENDEVSNGPSSPLTGAELAEKHGFEPIPDWKKDPFVRPMRIMVDGFAPAGQEPNNRVAYLCVQCQKVVPENAPCPHCSDAERLAVLPSESKGEP